MQAGKLRNRVTVQVATTTTNSYGQSVESWADVGTFWAYVRPLGGNEAVVAKQVQENATTAITLRWQGSTTLTILHRILFNGRVLGITQVNDVDERNRQLELLCQE